MVLLQIRPVDVAKLPLERNAPRSINMQTVPFRFAAERMEVETWEIQILETLRLIRRIEPSEASTL